MASFFPLVWLKTDGNRGRVRNKQAATKSSNGMQAVKQTWLAPRKSLRTNAKCKFGKVVLGGWFSLEVFPSDQKGSETLYEGKLER